MHEIEKTKKLVNQKTFLKQRVSKVKKKLIKQRRDNMEKEMVMHMFECLKVGEIMSSSTSKVDLNKLPLIIDQNLKDIDRRLDTGINSNNDSSVALRPQPVIFQNEEIEMNNVDGEEAILFDNEASLENEFWSNLQP
ncbi:agamous-like MADS-box protein AGL80 [Vicia villosa]|uniref:agamous-like MADS-box protein AGL80 n=1 Tax=Vicia villosa TaxID=3911 RepID=UPI00273AB712|nr:agamous-like MADS-box protein AGL80 [Vicia villosa]